MLNRTPVDAHQRERRAVSLVDLVITVLVMGILSAVAAPKFAGALSGYQVETAAQQIAADLNYARKHAIQRSADFTVTFTVSPAQYELEGISSLNSDSQSFLIVLTDEGYDVTFTSVDIDGEFDVTFNEYGMPFTGSPQTAVVSGQIVVRSGSDIRTVSIDPDTGRAEVL
ncbi:MAG: GspH/FimT family pseudopilin [Planctomycetaceae bacterium]|nr:GspH/FimT family pseudopilin [Planctomycetaceae bacterium]